MPKLTKKPAAAKPDSAEETRILSTYVRVAKRMGFHPSLSDMLANGVTRNQIRYYFGSITDLAQAAKKTDPKTFAVIIDGDVLSSRRFDEMAREVRAHQRFVITSAVTGAPVHKGFLASIQTYCEKVGAKLLVLPTMDPAAKTNRRAAIAPEVVDHLVTRDLSLNENLFLSSIKLSAKHIDPITGLGRIGQRDGSFIYASPKQRLKMVPTSNNGLPHALMTTGACTKSDYDSDRYMSHRTAYIADHDHIVGAIIVEVEDARTFHFRQVQADSRGRFVDLGKLYGPDGEVSEMPAEVLVLGDWHSRQNDPVARELFVEGKKSVRALLRPRVAVIHDGFDGLSVNPHEHHDNVLRSNRAVSGQLSLETELRQYAADLDMIASNFEEVAIARSNHDEFLDRYITAGYYLSDPINYRTAARIAGAMANLGDGAMALRVGVEMFGLQKRDSITWLEYDEDYKVQEIELGAHGHKGPNGARGSLRGMEAAYGSSVTGHAHTPEILRQAYQVGTCSYLKQGYNKGPSSWMHTSCVVYRNGSRQLINLIGRRWRLE